jgi:hypothetical protein
VLEGRWPNFTTGLVLALRKQASLKDYRLEMLYELRLTGAT